MHDSAEHTPDAMKFPTKTKATIGQIQASDQQLALEDAVARIEKINEGLRAFWSSSHGWAPSAAADLMSKSRLDRQVSLSRSLRHWIADPADSLEDGDLILAWANLGSLIEGTIKLFLAVYYEDYKNDVETIKQTQAWHKQKQKALDPDGLLFDSLINYVKKLNSLTTGKSNCLNWFRIDVTISMHLKIEILVQEMNCTRRSKVI